jgi:site-specific recombinase XerD
VDPIEKVGHGTFGSGCKVSRERKGYLELRGMSAATKKSYLTCCRVFVAYFMKSPEQLAAADIKEFLLHLMRQRKAGPSSVGVYVAAIRFLYRAVLRRPDAVDDLPRPRVPKKLPEVPRLASRST